MTTDFRALCAELLSEYEDSFVISEPSDDPLVQRARAALVEPEPPADGEVAELVTNLRAEADAYDGHDHTVWLDADDMRRAADLLSRLAPQPVPEGPSTDELHQVFLDHSGYIDDEQVMWSGRFCVAARAALARWGRP